MNKSYKKAFIMLFAVVVMVFLVFPVYSEGKQEAAEAEEAKPWEMINWNQPQSWPDRLLADEYILPEGWEKAVEGVDKITYYNSGGLETDIATIMNAIKFEDLTGIEIDPIPVAPRFVLPKTLSTLTAQDKSIHAIDMNNPSYHLSPIVGYLHPVNNLWPEEVQALYNENLEDFLAWKGNWYAMPVASVGHLNFYRKSWLEEAGLDVPTSMQDMFDKAVQLREWAKENKGNSYYGFVFSVPSTELFTRYRELMYAQDKEVIGPNGRLDFHSEEAMNAFGFLVNMFREDVTTADALNFAWTDAANFFGLGKAGMIMTAPAMFYGFFQSQYPEVGQDMGVLTNLKWSDDDPDAWNGRSLIGSNSMGIPTYIDDNHKAAVMLWFDYLRSMEGQRNEAIVEGNSSFLLKLWEDLDAQIEKVDWDLADRAAEQLEINKPVRRTEAGPMIKGNAIQSEKSLLEVFPPYFSEVQTKFNEEFANAAGGEISMEEAMANVQDFADNLR